MYRIRTKIKLFLLVSMMLMAVGIHTLANADAKKLTCPDFPFFEPKEGPITMVNCDFHHAYDARVKEELKAFGKPGGRPIILQLAGKLIFKHNGRTETKIITPLIYHQLKSFGHVPFAIYLLLAKHLSHESEPESQTVYFIDHDLEQQLKNLLLDLQRARQDAQTNKMLLSDYTLIISLLKDSENFVSDLLQTKQFNAAALQQYMQQVLVTVNKMLYRVSEVELNLLDQTINTWLQQLTTDEKKQLGIVIAVVHQARAKELSLLYFAHKFGFTYGDGAESENGFVVMEDKFDEGAALNLLARHYVDRAAGSFMYHVPNRLQYDLLGDEGRRVIEDQYMRHSI